ncbi:hypothetical protein VQ574_20995 (plasmid) [Stutzerimonas frequens]|uniref:hypothetical protein n=1 Tax=Stutzerimonas frequens TaxID=2968969 RepID=UPI002DBAAE32|nr:hypothetical protein [Stutzerimonas frequens]WRW29416.1 hypothetical protein VQ574_20995 [Stutzerimonas frequens]
MKKELPRYTVEARARLFGEESAAASAFREADSRAKAGEEVAFFDTGETILVGPMTSESASKRPSGFYRVKEEGNWTVAKFDARFDQWESIGEEGYSVDDSWEEIDPNRIAMPGDDAPPVDLDPSSP